MSTRFFSLSGVMYSGPKRRVKERKKDDPNPRSMSHKKKWQKRPKFPGAWTDNFVITPPKAVCIRRPPLPGGYRRLWDGKQRRWHFEEGACQACGLTYLRQGGINKFIPRRKRHGCPFEPNKCRNVVRKKFQKEKRKE